MLFITCEGQTFRGKQMKTEINNQMQELKVTVKVTDFLNKLGIVVKGQVESIDARMDSWDSDKTFLNINVKVKEVDRLKQIDYSKESVKGN